MTTRIVICDEDPLLRAGLRAVLQATDDLEVVAEASTGLGAVAAARQLEPDLVVMDGDFPDTPEPKVISELANPEDGEPIPVMVLAAPVEDHYLIEVVHVGARGVLHKGVELEEVLRTARVIAAGEAALGALTDREREILALVARGWSITRIARELSLGTATVKAHFYHLRGKLNLQDRVHAVIFAYEYGLESPGTSDLWRQ